MKKLFYFLLLITFSTICFAVNTPSLPPDPSCLCPSWWSYFEKNQGELPERAQEFEAQLQQSIQPLKGETRDKANFYFDKINANLHAYIQALAYKKTNPLPTSPIAKSYSLDHVLEIFRTIKKKELDIAAFKEEKAEKQQLLNSAQEHLDRTSIQYSKAEDRSAEKFLMGLEIIAYQASLEASKHFTEYLRHVIQTESNEIEALREELEKATQRVTVNHFDLKKYANEVNETEQNWAEHKKILEERSNSVVPLASPDPTEIAEVKHQHNTQDLMFFSVKETAAHLEFVQSQMLFALARLIKDPASADLSVIKARAAEWLGNIETDKEKYADWSESVRKLYLRYTQHVTMGDKNPAHDLKETANLQEDVIAKLRTNFMLIQRLGNQLEDTEFVLKALEAKTNSLLGGSQRWMLDLVQFSGTTYAQAKEWLETPLFHINERPITFSSILKFIAIMLLAIWVSRNVAKALTNFALNRPGIHKSFVYRITRLLEYLIMIAGLLLALTVIGFDFSSLLLIAGALGVGLGFGLQSIFNNFISGIIILFESHLKVGDVIEFGSGVKGEIREINVRSTIISTGNGSDIIIPNSEIITEKVTNWTMRDSFRKIEIPFSIAKNEDKDITIKVIKEAALKNTNTLSLPGYSEPSVNIIGFADNGLDMELSVWLTEKAAANIKRSRSDYLSMIDETLRKNTIEASYAQLEVKVVERQKAED